MLKEAVNAATFLRLALPFKIIRTENGAFRKRSSNWRNFKAPALCLGVDGKRWHYDNKVIFLPEFPQTQFKK